MVLVPFTMYIPVYEKLTEASGQIRTIHNLWCGENSAPANEQGQITHRYFGQGEGTNDKPISMQ